MLIGSIKKLFEQKSYNSALSKNVNPTTSASVYIGGDGSFLKTIYYTADDEIGRNLTVNTIINKQNSIVNEARLVVKEKSDSQDVPTKQKEFLDFINWINNPNSRPFPTSRNDIFKYMLSNYYKKGIYGVIYTFSKDMTFRNIQIPSCIYLESSFLETKYRLSLKNKSYTFTYSGEYRNYGIETETEIMILQVGGNFSNDLQNYVSYFYDSLPYILLQNYLVDAAESFQRNSCFPSQIITVTYERPKDEIGPLDATQKNEFKEAVELIERDIRASRGSRNNGGTVMASSPNIKIDIKPLNIPMNAKDNIDYQTFVSQNIYPLVDGGSINSYQGVSEYSSNLITGLENMYDGAFRQFNSVVIDSMNRFMRNLVSWMNKYINAENFYITFDESSVKIYQQKTINEVISLTQNNLLKINQGQTIVAGLAERYAFIVPSPEDDIYNSQLSGNATKPRVEVKSIDTKPTDEMVKNAQRALEWRQEFNRGGTSIGVARANQIVNRENLSQDTIQRMISYFARHEVDKKAKGFFSSEEGFPSAGRIAWDLWGGDAGKSWAMDKLNQLEKD